MHGKREALGVVAGLGIVAVGLATIAWGLAVEWHGAVPDWLVQANANSAPVLKPLGHKPFGDWTWEIVGGLPFTIFEWVITTFLIFALAALFYEGMAVVGIGLIIVVEEISKLRANSLRARIASRTR